MYVPEKWKMADSAQINRFLANYSFATLVSPSLEASRLPLYLDQSKQQLLGHFARSNQHWQQVDGQTCLAIFDEPHSYIPPTWYQSVPAALLALMEELQLGFIIDSISLPENTDRLIF